MESLRRESNHHLECIRQLEALVEAVKLELSDLCQQMVDKEFEDIQVTDEVDLLRDVIRGRLTRQQLSQILVNGILRERNHDIRWKDSHPNTTRAQMVEARETQRNLILPTKVPSVHSNRIRVDLHDHSVEEDDKVDSDKESTVERMAAILTTNDREYWSAMRKRAVDNGQPLREHKCLTMYAKINGVQALTLFDSGCSIDAISPEFAKVANLSTFKLDTPIPLQLGCVDSRSVINFGVR